MGNINQPNFSGSTENNELKQSLVCHRRDFIKVSVLAIINLALGCSSSEKKDDDSYSQPLDFRSIETQDKLAILKDVLPAWGFVTEIETLGYPELQQLLALSSSQIQLINQAFAEGLRFSGWVFKLDFNDLSEIVNFSNILERNTLYRRYLWQKLNDWGINLKNNLTGLSEICQFNTREFSILVNFWDEYSQKFINLSLSKWLTISKNSLSNNLSKILQILSIDFRLNSDQQLTEQWENLINKLSQNCELMIEQIRELKISKINFNELLNWDDDFYESCRSKRVFLEAVNCPLEGLDLGILDGFNLRRLQIVIAFINQLSFDFPFDLRQFDIYWQWLTHPHRQIVEIILAEFRGSDFQKRDLEAIPKILIRPDMYQRSLPELFLPSRYLQVSGGLKEQVDCLEQCDLYTVLNIMEEIKENFPETNLWWGNTLAYEKIDRYPQKKNLFKQLKELGLKNFEAIFVDEVIQSFEVGDLLKIKKVLQNNFLKNYYPILKNLGDLSLLRKFINHRLSSEKLHILVELGLSQFWLTRDFPSNTQANLSELVEGDWDEWVAEYQKPAVDNILRPNQHYYDNLRFLVNQGVYQQNLYDYEEIANISVNLLTDRQATKKFYKRLNIIQTGDFLDNKIIYYHPAWALNVAQYLLNDDLWRNFNKLVETIVLHNLEFNRYLKIVDIRQGSVQIVDTLSVEDPEPIYLSISLSENVNSEYFEKLVNQELNKYGAERQKWHKLPQLSEVIWADTHVCLFTALRNGRNDSNIDRWGEIFTQMGVDSISSYPRLSCRDETKFITLIKQEAKEALKQTKRNFCLFYFAHGLPDGRILLENGVAVNWQTVSENLRQEYGRSINIITIAESCHSGEQLKNTLINSTLTIASSGQEYSIMGFRRDDNRFKLRGLKLQTGENGLFSYYLSFAFELNPEMTLVKATIFADRMIKEYSVNGPNPQATYNSGQDLNVIWFA